ncbi:MAG: glycine betaine ABC transporter substrate-binding protein [Ardenticatenaceae bacterium]
MMRHVVFRRMSDQNHSGKGPFMLGLKIMGRALLMMLVLGLISGCGEPILPPKSTIFITPPTSASTPISPTPTNDPTANKRIVVGSKDFTEQRLLSQMLILILQEKGYEVDKTQEYKIEEIRDALVNGEIDIYWEYTGTALSNVHSISPGDLPSKPDKAFNQVKSLDKRHYGLIWLKPANFNNTYTLLVQRPLIDNKLGEGTLQHLAKYMKENDAPLTLCAEKDFIGRQQDGLGALEREYGFEFTKTEEEEFENRLINYERLRNGECDVAEGFSTDAQINAWGLRSLSDTKDIFPRYNPAPVIRQEVLDKHPELEQLLGQIGDKLDEVTMRKLNQRVDLGPDWRKKGDEESAKGVAKMFLCEVGLLSDCPIPPPPTPTPETKPEPAACGDIDINGGFERDSHWVLRNTVWPASYSRERVHQGERALLLGITNRNDDDQDSHSVAHQRVAIPPDVTSATLSYWYYTQSSDQDVKDLQGAQIYDLDWSSVQRNLLQLNRSNENVWVMQQHDLSQFIGQEIQLYFYVDNDGNEQPSAMYIDDVTLVCE